VQNESPKGQRLPRTVHTTRRRKNTLSPLPPQKNRRPMKKKIEAGSKNPPLSKLKRMKPAENRNRKKKDLKERIDRRKEKN
jgi:hypothetical protein